MYICTKYNDNFKFTLSLTLNGAKTFLAVPPNACLFSITRFLYGWQKIFTNKNIFQKHDLHVLFIAFLCKMYNKEKLFTTVSSPEVAAKLPSPEPICRHSLIVPLLPDDVQINIAVIVVVRRFWRSRRPVHREVVNIFIEICILYTLSFHYTFAHVLFKI